VAEEDDSSLPLEADESTMTPFPVDSKEEGASTAVAPRTVADVEATPLAVEEVASIIRDDPTKGEEQDRLITRT
jgi:hypothetical protein